MAPRLPVPKYVLLLQRSGMSGYGDSNTRLGLINAGSRPANLLDNAMKECNWESYAGVCEDNINEKGRTEFQCI